METKVIDKAAPLPYYVQLRDILSDEIGSGRWKPNDQIQSESELCAMYDVSRAVVRQALNDLVHEGKLVRRKGKGTFVAQPKVNERLMQSLTGFYEEAVARGQTPHTEVLRLACIAAPEHVRQRLELDITEPVIVLDRLRSIGGEPHTLVVTYLPYNLVPKLLLEDMSNQSLYALIEQTYGLRIAVGHRTVEAIGADARAARLLGLNEGDPILLLTSVSYLDSGRPIEYFEAQHPGNRSRFEVSLIREHTPAAAQRRSVGQ